MRRPVDSEQPKRSHISESDNHDVGDFVGSRDMAKPSCSLNNDQAAHRVVRPFANSAVRRSASDLPIFDRFVESQGPPSLSGVLLMSPVYAKDQSDSLNLAISAATELPRMSAGACSRSDPGA